MHRCSSSYQIAGKPTLLVLFLVFPLFLFSQNFILEGKIPQHVFQKLYLAEIYRGNVHIIDSTLSNKNGNFSFILQKDAPAGMYRIIPDEENFIDIIFNKENISFIADKEDVFNSMQVISSLENRIYYEYLKKKNYDNYRLELLQPLLAHYPKKDAFYAGIKQEFNDIQYGLDDYISELVKKIPGSLATKIIAVDRKPLIDPEMSPVQQRSFLKEHYFDNLQFSDTLLLRTKAVNQALLSYISFYQDKDLNKQQIEDEFIKATGHILSNIRADKSIYTYVIDFLISGFERYGFDRVISYIVENVDEESCEYEGSDPDWWQRMETLRKLVEGNPAPPIQAVDTKNTPINLAELTSNYTLILFWASWCPHCTDILSEVHDFYQKNKGDLEILAVSLDTLPSQFFRFMDARRYPWITIADFKGWESPIALDYGVNATPAMFLLDKHKRILGKPSDVGEIQKILENHQPEASTSIR